MGDIMKFKVVFEDDSIGTFDCDITKNNVIELLGELKRFAEIAEESLKVEVLSTLNNPLLT